MVDGKNYPIEETDKLGFEEKDGLRIPDDYLDNQQFIVMRTAHGIGDWGIISAMPRLLKQKYPNCKVFLPTQLLLKKMFGQSHDNVEKIFAHNPYVDGVVDNFNGEVFHDQYRVYDDTNTDIPLLKQMLRFWQFTDEEMSDSQPEMYWSENEKNFGDMIISDHSKGEFGSLLISDRFGTQFGKHHQESYDKDKKVITNLLNEYPLPYFHWSSNPMRDTPFDFINKALDMRHIDLRIQLYIKSKAKVNISNQCGTNHLVVRYSKCFESQRQYPIAHNFVEGDTYL
tara:strand:- start:1114 stop:1965 length:852 start_codon:yes stop_codon:yes gene_type:complete